MATPSDTPNSETSGDPRVPLAIQRTEYALVNTQLAWIRTVLAVIGAAVVLDQGMAYLRRQRIGWGGALELHAHALALLLSGGATVFLVIATIRYRRNVAALARMQGSNFRHSDPGLLLSVLITVLGIAVFASFFVAD